MPSNLKIHTMQVVLPRYFGQDFWIRVKYRAEFIKRNPGFQSFENKLFEYFETRDNKKTYQKLVELAGGLFPEDPLFATGILRLPSEHLAEDMALQSMASIEVLSEKKKASDSRYLEYHQLDGYWKMRLKTQDKVLMPRITDSVDRKDNTIKIKIHLDRQKEDIIRDVNYLINLVDREAKHLGIDRRKPKRPQWDIYEKYLQVFDEKISNPKVTWLEIAKKVLPKEVHENITYHRKRRKKEKIPPETKKKLKYYWKEGQKMINKGGWQNI